MFRSRQVRKVGEETTGRLAASQQVPKDNKDDDRAEAAATQLPGAVAGQQAA